MNPNEELLIIINKSLEEHKEKYPVLQRLMSVASGKEKIVQKVRKYIIIDGIEDVSEAIAQVVMELQDSAK